MGCKAFKHSSKQTSPQAHVISPTNTESPMESKLTQLFEKLQTQTKAITGHDGPRVRFNHPSMNFEIKCGDSNPLASFPHLSSQTSNSGPCSSAHVACLLTAVPPPTQPKEHVSLHRGFNLVTPCLVMGFHPHREPFIFNPFVVRGWLSFSRSSSSKWSY